MILSPETQRLVSRLRRVEDVSSDISSPLPFNVHVVRTEEDIAKALKEFGRAHLVGLDVETDIAGSEPNAFEDTLVGAAVAFGTEVCYGEATNPSWIELLSHITRWCGHNSKYDYNVLLRHGIRIAAPVGDSMLAAYLLGYRAAPLKPLVEERYGYRMRTYEEVTGGKPISTVDIEEVATYCGSDAYWTLRLEQDLVRELQKQPRSWKLYKEVDVPLVGILARMELRGVAVDQESIASAMRQTAETKEVLERVLNEMARTEGFALPDTIRVCPSCRNGKRKRVSCTGCEGQGRFSSPTPINLRSADQLGAWLHGRAGLPVQVLTPRRKPSVNALALLRMKDMHPAPSLILEHRRLQDYGEYLEQWKEAAKGDGRTHTDYTNAWVRSGRLSSRNPNLQQVALEWRKHFAASEGKVLVAGDYGQLEVRVAAFLSRDPNLMAICSAEAWPDNDLHAQTMRNVFGIPFDKQEPLKGLRVSAKTCFFAKLYGGKEWTVREQIEKAALRNPGLNIVVPSENQVKKYLDGITELFSQHFREYVPRAIERARNQGCVAFTAWGRRRALPDLRSDDWKLREAAERQVISHEDQGTASDIVRYAMLVVDKLPHGALVLQVHDELVSEVDEGWAEWYTVQMREAMTLNQPLEGVPLTVEVRSGRTWFDTHA